jgi:hypothetical protein
MLNFKSVTNSEPQIRSNPALRQAHHTSGFHKRLSTLLQPTPLPFPTFQLVKDVSSRVLSTFQHYAWVRPVHLRCQWLVLAPGSPAMLVDAKDSSRLFTIRIPFDTSRLEREGLVVCEVAWDSQDHILWIWDVIVWQHQVTWGILPYSRRWDLVKDVVTQILDSGHPMSDAEVRVPEWKSLEELHTLRDLDPATSIEFQPEQAGQRRFLYRVPSDSVAYVPANYAERKLLSEEKRPHRNEAKSVIRKPTPAQDSQTSTSVPVQIQNRPVEDKKVDPSTSHANPISKSTVQLPPSEQPLGEQLERPTVCKISKDKYSKMPDSYRLTSVLGEDLGLAAIRTLEMSKLIRTVLAKPDSTAFVDIAWCESFQKYEVRKVNLG